MRLIEIIEKLENHSIENELRDFEVKGISCNSKSVSYSFIFVAIKGTHIDADKFIPEAIAKGAGAVIIQDGAHESVKISEYYNQAVFIKVADTRRALAVLAAEFWAHPSLRLHVVGITGTNGKTTVSYLIEAIVKEVGATVGVVGTVNYRFKDRIIPSVNTTPGPVELESLLAQMSGQGVSYVAMEVSSHALDQERIGGIDFKSAIFTNLTQDHLDYHVTLDNYFQAKARLFKDLKPGSFAVINNDDEYGRKIIGLTKAGKITYSIDGKAEVRASDISFDIKHTEFIVNAAGLRTDFKSKLIGRHNVYNMLAAISWAMRAGIEIKVIRRAIANFSSVPGRLERIDSTAPFTVFVDYAHTEDALKNVITTLREFSLRKIISVFGCGGDRDRGKRPKMGEVVSRLSDYMVITSDNPRSEDPLAIIEEIVKGVKNNNYCVIPDRKEAIRKSLLLAKPADIVLVAGKGHEDYQVLRTGKVHFDDREAIRECLKLMGY
ncbi:MAG: UDP-N-acetylmuramoyl-L-alanyl-D-glutamate--2,6-diaminopimelate ligase [Candidatus Omnitrophota bacterium]